MSVLRVLLNDHLSFAIASLDGIDKTDDVVLMAEVREEYTIVKHHKKKLAFLISAMRHFAQELEQNEYQVSYIKLDDKHNTGTLIGEIERYVQKHKPEKVVVAWPSDYRILQQLKKLKKQLSVPLDIVEDTRFLASHEEFKDWAASRSNMLMEFFYRQMRQKHNILMHEGKPVGGQWNYDKENRKFPKEALAIPQASVFHPDVLTQEVLALVDTEFADHFGDLLPFAFAVKREQALHVLDVFIKERLNYFGDYQDAMLEGEPWMFHSHVSFYINIGLLDPLECIKAAEKAYYNGTASLNAVEGFIRQLLGWREYVRGIYWLKMPEYKTLNFFNAQRKLPQFYWTANTKMNCLKQCVSETKKNAYAHHIQRLMVLGNFALLAGIAPDEVNEWFLVVYADAYEWVELPNVTGMILFADGGILASKPYAASGAYINKMSNYCKKCPYDVKQKEGPKACPFNYLYWDFLMRNHKKLAGNHRLGMIYKVLEKMDHEKIKTIQKDAQAFLDSLES